jgi:hypothetical protein
MLALKPLTVDEMRERWARVRKPAPQPAEPAPRPLNMNHILDLGNVVFFTFRGRAYGIPPLAWRDGEELLDAWLEARELGEIDDRAKVRAYFEAIRRLQVLLWRACRPVGPFRRLLRLLHLHANPFRRATEGEIAELALFMLGRRMTAHNRAPEVAKLANLHNGGTS